MIDMSALFACAPEIFPGGLSQQDWLTMPGTIMGTSLAMWTYNSSALANQLALRQAQMYQHKNYHLSWITVARDDIRQLMATSVNRINNYMLVATLILGIACQALFWVNNFDSNCPSFMINFFWLSMGTSIMFLSISIMLGIKGQNSAFVNTMRLLTWECRPENPGNYDHDYMQQIQTWERGGVANLFRLPGQQIRAAREQKPRHTSGTSDASSELSGSTNQDTSNGSDSRPSAEQSRNLEEVAPHTRELLYLARFANFMKLWVPYETYAKYSIGLGLISLSQGAAYFSLGSLYDDAAVYRNAISVAMVAMFVFLTLLIYAQNNKAKTSFMQALILLVFMWGPVAATIASLVDKGSLAMGCFACLSCLGQSVLFFGIYVVTYSAVKSSQQAADVYIKGPHGEEFTSYPSSSKNEAHDGRPSRKGRSRRNHKLARGIIGKDSFDERDEKGFTIAIDAVQEAADANCAVASNQDCHTCVHEAEEDKEAQLVQRSVSVTVRLAVLLVALIWFFVFIVGLLDLLDLVSASTLPVLDVQRLPVDWPADTFLPTAIACSSNEVWVSDRYRIFKLHGNGSLSPVQCPRLGPIIDIHAACSGGQQCKVIALLEPETDSTGARQKLVDCDLNLSSSTVFSQETVPASRFSVGASGDVLRNPQPGVRGLTQMHVMHDTGVVEYGWSSDGWVPMVRVAEVKPSTDAPQQGPKVVSIDTSRDKLFLFGVNSKVQGSVSAQSASIIQVKGLEKGSKLVSWRLPRGYPHIIGGCTSGPSTIAVIRDSQPPEILTARIP